MPDTTIRPAAPGWCWRTRSLGSVVAYETLWARPDVELALADQRWLPRWGMPNVVFDHRRGAGDP